MGTQALKVQANGRLREWTSIVGAADGAAAVDDSDGTSHDGDVTHLLIDGPAFVSFAAFHGAEHLIPSSITARVAAAHSGNGGQISVGIFTPEGFASLLVEGLQGNYTIHTQSFVVHPFTLEPWQSEDLKTIELGCNITTGQAKITLVSGTLTYDRSNFKGDPEVSLTFP